MPVNRKTFPQSLREFWQIADGHRLVEYLAVGGYETARKVLTTMTPEEVIEEVKDSRLRGRGGAGFPTGLKWNFIPVQNTRPHYLVINADESEPGTFKDKYIMMYSPHLLLEGILIASYAIRAHTAYLYVRGEYDECRRRLLQAIDEAYSMGFLGRNVLGSGFNLNVFLHKGAGAYIAGEETGLLESLEGKRAYPRVKPPFPAHVGAFHSPTAINNVETLAYVPLIMRFGSRWFASMGTATCGGLKLYCVSGHIEKPGVYELPMSVTLREIIDQHAGGVWKGRKLKAVIPGGSSAPVLTPAELDITADFDSLIKAGSMLGSAGIVVMDDHTCMVRALKVISEFYADETCGQCTPCREGTPWLLMMVEQILENHAHSDILEQMEQVAHNILGRTICALGDAAALPVLSFLAKFRDEFIAHVAHGRCDVVDQFGEISNPDPLVDLKKENHYVIHED